MGVTFNPFSLEGKTILVTGASSGIGAQTAIDCSKMGASVVITARNEERLKHTLDSLEGDGHKMIVADLNNEADVENLLSNLPKLNGAVLCAGVGFTLPFLFCTRSKIDDVFNINFFAPIELMRLLAKKKKMETDSSVVFVSSIGGVNVFNVGNSVYGASKGAINTMVKQIALEIAPKKIRVNSVNPGMINTKLIREGMTLTEEQLKADEDRYPLKRYGETSDVSNGIIYLLSDASCWVTGHALVIDGGVSLV